MDKLVIGICDDEILILQQLKKMVKALLDEKGVTCDIRTYLSAAELICDAAILEVLFLDIEMPKTDGIEAGRSIKKINPKCKIIMATSRVDRFKESFYIEALRFITKPFDRVEVEEAIDIWLKQKLGSGRIELYHERNLYYIIQRDIEYVRAYDGYLECKCNRILFRKECSLKAIYEELDRRLFVRISRSYIVNMSFITKYDKGIIVLQNETMKVSRREKKNFECIWINYDLNYE